MNSIRACEQAETSAKSSQDVASNRKKVATTDAKKNIENALKQAETIVKSIRSIAKETDPWIDKLKLVQPQIPIYNLPNNLAVKEYQILITQQYERVKKASLVFVINAKELLEERKKWWKFW